MELIPLFIALGLLSGFLSGLLGIGGGIITVPAIYYILSWNNPPDTAMMQTAVATSLAAIFITTLSTTIVHYRRGKSLHYEVLGYLLPGLIIGCICGAELANYIPGVYLREIFGLVAIFIGIYFVQKRALQFTIAIKPNSALTFFAFAIGLLSSLLGIGGGIFTIPLLLGYQIPAAKTVATSSVSTLTTSLIGTITYLVIATEHSTDIHPLGFIDVPVFLCISLASICTTPIGVKLSQTLPSPLIKRIFGGVLLVTGLIMILS